MLQCRQASLCEQHTSFITRFIYFIGLVFASSRNKVSQIKIVGGKEREEAVSKDWKLFFQINSPQKPSHRQANGARWLFEWQTCATRASGLPVEAGKADWTGATSPASWSASPSSAGPASELWGCTCRKVCKMIIEEPKIKWLTQAQ